MSIVVLHDLEGDLVAVESTAIVAVRAGRVERDADILDEVTLISLPSCTVAVREPTEVVIAQWRAARMASSPRPDAPVGWAFHDIVKRSTG